MIKIVITFLTFSLIIKHRIISSWNWQYHECWVIKVWLFRCTRPTSISYQVSVRIVLELEMPNKVRKPIYTSIMTNNFLEQFTTSCKGYKYTKCCFCFHWLLELNLCTSWLIRETFHWKNIGNFWPGPTRGVGLKLLNREFTSMIWSDSEIKSNRGINLERKRIQFPVSL